MSKQIEEINKVKVAIIGDVSDSAANTQGQFDCYEKIGNKLAGSQIDLFYIDPKNLDGTLNKSFVEAGGASYLVQPINGNSTRRGGSYSFLSVEGNTVSIYETIFTHIDVLLVFPGGVDTLACLTYCWVKNQISGSPKNIYLIGSEWNRLIETMASNNIVGENDLKLVQMRGYLEFLEEIEDFNKIKKVEDARRFGE